MAVQRQSRRLVFNRIPARELSATSLVAVAQAVCDAAGHVAAQKVTLQFSSYNTDASSLEEAEQHLSELPAEEEFVSGSVTITRAAGQGSITIAMNVIQAYVQFNGQGADPATFDEARAAYDRAVEELFGISLIEERKLPRLLDQHRALVRELEELADQARAIGEMHASSAEASEAIDRNHAASEEAAVQAKAAATAAAEARQAAQAAKGQVDEIRQESTTIQVSLKSYQSNVESFEKRMEEAQQKGEKAVAHLEQRIQDDLTSLTNATNQRVQTFENETQDILTRNGALQDQVNALLSGAVAGRLHEVFEQRKNDRKKRLWLWIGGIVLVTLAAVAAPFAALQWWPTDGELGGALLVRLSVALPLLVLDGFLIYEFSRTSTLIREYEFKSAVALSLKAYEEVLAEKGRPEVVQTFLLEAIREIYRPPVQSDQPRSLRQAQKVVEFLREAGLVDATKSAALPIKTDK